MENVISIPLQIVVVLVSILGSGIAVYAALKVGLAESKKDIAYMTKAIETLDRRITNHVESPYHPTGEQVKHLTASLDDFKEEMGKTHNRIEKKVDTLMDVLLKNTNNR
jgi:Mg2+ and Co2+ transporter CorA